MIEPAFDSTVEADRRTAALAAVDEWEAIYSRGAALSNGGRRAKKALRREREAFGGQRREHAASESVVR